LKNKVFEQFVFLLLIAGWFTFAAWQTINFPRLARTFPLFVTIGGLLLAIIEFGRTFYHCRSQSENPLQDDDPNHSSYIASISESFPKAFPYLLWLGGYYIGIFLVGFVVASGLFIVLFLVFIGRARFWFSLAGAGLLIIGILVLGRLLVLEWPRGIAELWLNIEIR
jgi:hypothetical protein